MDNRHRSRAPRRRCRWLGRGLALAGVALLAACGPPGDRADHHLRQAEALLAEGRGREAILELHSAALLRPDDVDLGLRVAELSLQHGFFGDAVDYYRDALALRPEDTQTALKLAQLLLEIDPRESKKRVNELLEKDPRNAHAWLIRARAALIDGEVNPALGYVARARSIDPSEPETERILALAYETRGRLAMARNPLANPSPRVGQSILKAYDRYLALDGEYRLLGLLGRARTLARLPDRREQTRDAFYDALDEARTIGSPYEKIRVTREASSFADVSGDNELAQRAVEQWIETAPRDLDAWRALIGLDAPDPSAHKRRTYDRLVHMLPDHPEAHALYAEYLLEEKGYADAVAYLEKKMDGSEADAGLLIGIVQIQNRTRRTKDAAGTLNELETRFPNFPAARLARGEQQLLAEDYDAAAETLRAALSGDPTARGFRLLARAEQKRGQLERALAAIKQSNAADNRTNPISLRLEARIQAELGKHAAAAGTLLTLHRRVGLTPGEKLLLARNFYKGGNPGVGRKILLDILADESPDPRAALDFARRDGHNPVHRPAIRRHLARVLEEDPEQMEVLETLTELDLVDGQIEEARQRLDDAVKERGRLGRIYLIRGKLLLRLGEFVAARDDAERASRLDPASRDEAYDIMTAAYLNDGNVPALVARMESQANKHGLTADRAGLLGRLNLAIGNTRRALELYEQAAAEESGLLFVKNDLAFLLAQQGVDLDRALALAKAAVESPSGSVSTIDTLGYVYLKRGEPDVAVWQFRQAVADATPPVPDYYFHLGMALFELGKNNQAREALEEALALNPEFADADAARQLLSELESRNQASKPPAS
ncbi:MAG: tetratricopeptide repeat protein [Myxococcota bacterium]|nr:tetratricopeptide repeat protein [Myxococcota bacterium]